MISFTPQEFDQTLTDHQRLIELTNDLEYRLHVLAGDTTPESVSACQLAAGSLVEALRQHLFHQDQVVLPLLDRLVVASRSRTEPFGEPNCIHSRSSS